MKTASESTSSHYSLLRHIALLFIALVLTAQSQAQSAKKIASKTQWGETWVKTANLHNVVDCSLQPSTTYLTNKRIIFTSPGITLDLKIYKREKSRWYARDPQNVEYVVLPVTHAERPDEPAIMMLPSPDSGLLGVMISRYPICENREKSPNP